MPELHDNERVVITGMGCVSAAGIGTAPFWDAVVHARSAIRPVTRGQADRAMTAPAAAIDGFELQRHVVTTLQALLDPFAQYGVVAAQEAIADAGWALDSMPLDEVAVILGNTCGGESTRELEAARIFHFGKRNVSPVAVVRTNHQSLVGTISMLFDLRGPAFVVHSGCASATHAIAQAYLMLRHGHARYALTGGSEAAILYSSLQAFQALGVVATDTCRPFSRDRTGMALGEGAGIVALETLASARARGARIYAELAGVGITSDAADPVNPNGKGAEAAMRHALRMAQLEPDQVGYVNAHGTGTRANDLVESAAIGRVFGAGGGASVSSTKAVHGHALGATGGFELIATALALRHGVAPPTANVLSPDPLCPIDLVANEAREMRIDAALSNSFGLGGLNSVLAILRCE